MERIRSTKYIECDACEYVIELTPAAQAQGANIKTIMSTLFVPFGDGVTFHFHGPDGTHRDCFRYWAHSPRIMERSLTERGFDQGAIDNFMMTHLYRQHDCQPGMTRSK